MRGLTILMFLAGVSAATPLDEQVGTRFDGERALRDVEALDSCIRWPGNRHFDDSLAYVIDELKAAGFVESARAAADDRLVYRVDAAPMRDPAWLPLEASLKLGDRELLNLETNRNMLAIHSHGANLSAEVVAVDTDRVSELRSGTVRGRIALIEGDPRRYADTLLGELGAAGILAYSMPAYTRPEVNSTAIQFRALPYTSDRSDWAIMLSFEAYTVLRDALAAGAVTVQVNARVEWRADALDRALIASVRGSAPQREELLFSAHLQEPGANDNASGVATQLEMARVAASLIGEGLIDPQRSLTFHWGSEIVSIQRYIEDAAGRKVRWGISLDMVGNNTAKTGGSFLIEKMPDPSAIWQRGGERFSEWGGRPLEASQMRPHYLNDLMLTNARRRDGWVVNTNPFEGGSDHVPFLRAGIPALLLWHFTDQFYHTDLDRPDKVSAGEMHNVGVSALATGLQLVSPDDTFVERLVSVVEQAGYRRLDRESGINEKDDRLPAKTERRLLHLWYEWYDGALTSVLDVPLSKASPDQAARIDVARQRLREHYTGVSASSSD